MISGIFYADDICTVATSRGALKQREIIKNIPRRVKIYKKKGENRKNVGFSPYLSIPRETMRKGGEGSGTIYLIWVNHTHPY